ncbi:MAG: rhomboid family intramembrane serine protease, partial [Bacteroidetes bacterium]|nr:rhomboid family intramembrane serine protease [Bacteroidota bacterium]MBM3456904.1 rhomboid family intramembrane serine protease [Bacteroidota bacterium]
QFGAHYVNSPLFQPFQIVTHFFMHAGFLHIFFNMWLFVMLGGYLERIWGPKRFFIFYISCALGAFALYNAIGVYQIIELSNVIGKSVNVDQLNLIIAQSEGSDKLNSNLIEFFQNVPNLNLEAVRQYISLSTTPMVGASGAIFGVMAAFAILFPNTEFMLYFAIPVKAKYLVGLYFLLEVYLAYKDNVGDNTAHLAHVGGAIVGGIIVLFWRKSDRTNFW